MSGETLNLELQLQPYRPLWLQTFVIASGTVATLFIIDSVVRLAGGGSIHPLIGVGGIVAIALVVASGRQLVPRSVPSDWFLQVISTDDERRLRIQMGTTRLDFDPATTRIEYRYWGYWNSDPSVFFDLAPPRTLHGLEMLLDSHDQPLVFLRSTSGGRPSRPFTVGNSNWRSGALRLPDGRDAVALTVTGVRRAQAGILPPFIIADHRANRPRSTRATDIMMHLAPLLEPPAYPISYGTPRDAVSENRPSVGDSVATARNGRPGPLRRIFAPSRPDAHQERRVAFSTCLGLFGCIAVYGILLWPSVVKMTTEDTSDHIFDDPAEWTDSSDFDRAEQDSADVPVPAWKGCRILVDVKTETLPPGGLEAVRAVAADLGADSGFELVVVEDGERQSDLPSIVIGWVATEDGSGDAIWTDGELVAVILMITSGDETPFELAIAVLQIPGNRGVDDVQPDELDALVRGSIATMLGGVGQPTKMTTSDKMWMQVARADDAVYDTERLRASAVAAGCPALDDASDRPSSEAESDAGD